MLQAESSAERRAAAARLDAQLRAATVARSAARKELAAEKLASGATRAALGRVRHGALGIAFRGQFHAHAMTLRLGSGLLEALRSWTSPPRRPPPWLSPDDVVIHIRTCEEPSRDCERHREPVAPGSGSGPTSALPSA